MESLLSLFTNGTYTLAGDSSSCCSPSPRRALPGLDPGIAMPGPEVKWFRDCPYVGGGPVGGGGGGGRCSGGVGSGDSGGSL